MRSSESLELPFPPPREQTFNPASAYSEFTDGESECPLRRVKLWNGAEAWLMTRFDDVRAMLVNRRFSADITKPGFPAPVPQQAADSENELNKTFVRMDPPQHSHFRRMLTGDFMVKRMDDLRPTILHVVDECLDEMERSGPPTDLVQSLALPVPSRVICEFLGVPYEDHAFFEKQTSVIGSGNSTGEQMMDAYSALRGYLEHLTELKAKKPADDLVSRLVTDYEQTGELDRNDLVLMIQMLLIAGHETTANMISFGTFALLEHPEEMAKLRSDPALISNGVEELMRFLTIIPVGLPRLATEDVEIGGQLIKAGEGAIALLPTANYDAAEFPDPERLDVSRPIRHHVAFGHGVHQCVGQSLARVELQVTLGRLLERFPGLRLAVPAEEVPVRFDSFVDGLYALPVAW